MVKIMSILEVVNQKKSALNAKYTPDQQAEKIQEYKSMFFKTIDDCFNYLGDANYKPARLEDNFKSMKAAIEYSNPVELYSFVETSMDVVELYQIPFSCKAAFTDLSVSVKSVLGDVNSEL